MIDQEAQIKIQAFLDGELAESEARDIVALIARDKSAAALHAELKHTRQAIAGVEQGIKLPETREFYWSKIARDIERLTPAPSAPPSASTWQMLSRLLKPLAAVSAVVVLAGILFQQTRWSGGRADFEVASVSMDAITFRDDSDGTTYVWFSDVDENDVAVDADATTLH